MKLPGKRILTTSSWTKSPAVRTVGAGHLSSKVRVRLVEIRNVFPALTKQLGCSISSKIPIVLNGQ